MKKVDNDSAGLWRQDLYLSSVSLMKELRLLSLSVFDTLLLRACSSPADVFEITGEKAAEASLLEQPITTVEFSELRLRAEKTARDRRWAEHKHGEITLGDIYAQFPQMFIDRNRLIELELEAEKQVVYLNPNVSSLLCWAREQGIKIALLSDTYFSAAQMIQLLERAGLSGSSVDTILVSNEVQGDKRSGLLFQKLLSQYPDIPSESVLHIGESLECDVEPAERNGIPSIHYDVIPDYFSSPYSWEEVRHGRFLPEIKSLRKLAAHSFVSDYDTEQELEFHRFGAGMMGPFLNALCEWAIDICVKENKAAIHPLMREGCLLGPMLQNAARAKGVDIAVKPLYVSRQAMYLPSMEQFGERELDRLLSNDMRIGDLFDMLHIPHLMEDFLTEIAVSGEEHLNLHSHETRERLRAFLLRAPMLEAINQSVQRQRELFIRYIRQECGAVPEWVTLDIGFYGTIQTGMERILRIAQISRRRSIHLLAVGMNQAELLDGGHDVRCFIDGSGPDRDIGKVIARSPAFLEELTMSDFGTTLGFKPSDNEQVEPIVAPLEQSDSQLPYKKAAQQGVFTYQAYLDYFRRSCPQSAAAEHPHREWALSFQRAVDMPTPDEARMLGGLTHQTNYPGEVLSICAPVGEQYWANGAAGFLDLCNFGPSTLNVFWPQGVVSMKFPYYRYEYFLRLQDSFGYKAMFVRLLLAVSKNRVPAVNIYGTGELTDTVIRMAQHHGIEVKNVIVRPEETDRRRAWGAFAYRPIGQVAEQNGPHVFIIASLTETDAIRSHIEAAYQDHAHRQRLSIYEPEAM